MSLLIKSVCCANEIRYVVKRRWGCDVHSADFVQQLEWSIVHPYLLDVCVALASLQLPPYVVLEIFDWLPTKEPVSYEIVVDHEEVVEVLHIDRNESCMQLVSHFKKIRLIEGVHHARRRVLDAREAKKSMKR